VLEEAEERDEGPEGVDAGEAVSEGKGRKGGREGGREEMREVIFETEV
jgi:hypothetical protein